jgi:hypothetical protein
VTAMDNSPIDMLELEMHARLAANYAEIARLRTELATTREVLKNTDDAIHRLHAASRHAAEEVCQPASYGSARTIQF